MYWVRLFLIPWGLTVVVEELASLCWGCLSRRDFLTVLWVNTVTNLPVTALRLLMNRFPVSPAGRTALVLVLEVLVLITEWLLFRRFLKNCRHPFWFSLTLNAASYGAGLLLPNLMQLFLK